ncbi:MAG: L-alanine exporter AlaE [Nanoarchaeota archaeon]|nr:L-alanine exporter AlaE [Nanoarchaeota archaeon]
MKLRQVGEWMKYHVVDTTAMLTSSNPIFGASEVFVAGMSDEVSIDSRLTVAGIAYTVMGPAFARGRDLSRKIFKITQDTKEKVQVLHDILYTSAFNLAVSPIIYLSMGADIKQTIIGSLSAGALAVGIGPIMGYGVDAGRDLMGLRECERKTYPDLIKRQRPSVKKGLAALLVGASIAAMAGIYALTPNRNETPNHEQPPAIEQVLKTSR